MIVIAREKASQLRSSSSSKYLPSTFEERGTAVPFTTPLLAHARVRKNYRGQLELCVPRFSDSEGQYVVPWAAVRELTQMTLHDRLLYEHVLANNVQTPHDMRMAALAVAKSGFAGPEVAEAAAKAITEDEEAKALNQVMLILRVLHETGNGAAASLRDVTTVEGQKRVRHALFAVADKLALPAEVLDERLTELAHITYRVGAEWSPIEGRLRQLIARLTHYRDSLRGWANERVNEAADKALFCGEVAEMTLLTGTRLLLNLDGGMRSPYSLVMQWDSAKEKVESLASRLSWLLDGWETIIEWWLGATEETEQVSAAEQMLPVLPLLPRSEIDADRTERLDGMVERSRRWVRLNQDWITGEFDLETIRRIEALKAKAI